VLILWIDDFLRDVPQRFSPASSPIGINSPLGHSTAETSDTPIFLTAKTMLTVDEPDHRRLRLLVSKVFTPRSLDEEYIPTFN
jgi:cytochrome P450